MKYSCLPKERYEKGDYAIVPLRKEDILPIKEWRNEQIHILRQQKPLTDQMQKDYYENVVKPTFQEKEPEQLLFSYLKEGQCIGYGGIVHIDWRSRRGELSFLLETSRMEEIEAMQGEYARFLTLMHQVAQDLKLHRLETVTYDVRPQIVAVIEAFGFHLEGIMKDHALVQGRHVDTLIHGKILD